MEVVGGGTQDVVDVVLWVVEVVVGGGGGGVGEGGEGVAVGACMAVSPEGV